MPLARMAMYAQGVDIYLAPTADSRPTWQATMQHIACEGRCFVLGCNQYVRLSDYPEDLRSQVLLPQQKVPQQDHIMSRGGSVIVSPQGEVLAGPLFDSEGVLCAKLDMTEITRARYEFDVVGHYAKPDVFKLTVDTSVHDPVVFCGSVNKKKHKN